MRVPGRVYAHAGLFSQDGHEEALQQVANVATLPGILKASIAMPDIHWGYGFPIGGVAAMDEVDGVVSPGGVGFDINCGVRLVRTGLGLEDVRPRLEPLMSELMRRVPQGSGPHGALDLKEGELERLAEEGAAFLAGRGLATPDDLAHTEEGGVLPGADAAAVSRKAFDRGRTQVGSLGSGNHFIEVQVVDDVLDERAASAFGVAAGQVVVMIHSGSRGFGHQVCTDFLGRMAGAAARAGIELPDRQLACAPLGSPEAREYLAAMACACNFAFANRQMMLHEVRGAFERVFRGSWERLGVELVYDVAHNIAKREVHLVDGQPRAVMRAPQGSDAGVRPGESRRAAGLPRGRPAGDHPRRHGARELAPRRHGDGDARDVGLHVPWGGPPALPARGPQGPQRRRGAARSGGRRHRREGGVRGRARRGGALRLQGCGRRRGRGGRRRPQPQGRPPAPARGAQGLSGPSAPPQRVGPA